MVVVVVVIALTSLLLLDGEVGPALLHPVTEGHPELGLLLKGHALPSLLDVGQRRVRDGVGRGGAAGDGRGRGTGGAHDCVAQHSGRRVAQHCESVTVTFEDSDFWSGDGSN